MKDFIIANFNNDTYGYISTNSKCRSYGFAKTYKDTIKILEEYGDFTYAKPDELAVYEHQRDWTAKDKIHYNKLKYFYDRYNYEMTKVLILSHGVER